MPSPLHPRSLSTTSLFGTTLLFSFVIVGMPHLFPCPAPRKHFTDGEMTEDGRKRRRRRIKPQEGEHEPKERELGKTEEEMDEGKLMAQRARECPVPKPWRIGEMLGLRNRDQEEGRVGERPTVTVEERDRRE